MEIYKRPSVADDCRGKLALWGDLGFRLASNEGPYGRCGAISWPGDGTSSDDYVGDGTLSPDHVGDDTLSLDHVGDGTSSDDHVGDGTLSHDHVGDGWWWPF